MQAAGIEMLSTAGFGLPVFGVDGHPLDLIQNLLNVRVTIKGGKIVHDARR